MTYETFDSSAIASAGSPVAGSPGHRLRRNKVPEVTVYFWVIKVLCTTVGETAADLLAEKAGLGLTGVSVLMSAVLAVVLVVQFRTKAYRAGVYWAAVALISVVGTLISDNLTDNMGVPLETSTTVFAVILAVVFGVWYRRERTLSIHHIDTTSRESFYWLAVLFTFALGTAAGDLVSERMDLGYWLSAVLFALAIAAVAVAHFALGLYAVWSFWIAYILTRPLGASIGDYLSQPSADGGLGLGTVVTSVLFLAVILALVVYLAVSRKDVTDPESGVRQVA
ncbi:COG4705 family protein [Streptomyces sp. Tue6028]|uniref:COG4705 family protein n=1 Tax=Streptomyces sp. Tue6028 TaxID=2036037 RepID=UPI003D745F77